MAAVLSIDLGTSGCRSAIYDSTLNMLSSSCVEYPLIVISDTEIEQDANLWWESVKTTIKGALATCPIPMSDIKSISISSQGIAFVPIDHDGNILSNAISWLDNRGTKEVDELRVRYGDRWLYEKTGKRLSTAYTLSKLIWFHKHHRPLYEAAWKILFPMDFIQYRLSGKCVIDHTMAAGTMFYDVKTHNWMSEFLVENGLSSEKFSEIAWSGKLIGQILPNIAEELGLSHDVIIVNGAQDQKCAALSAGASSEIAAASLGTGCCIAQITTKIAMDSKMRIPFFSYICKGQWDMEGVINTAGSAYSWFHDKFSAGCSFNELDDMAASVSLPNSVMFFPYLAGGFSPNWDIGTGTFTGLSFLSDIGHFARAILEGVAYNIRANIDAIGDSCGRAKELRLYGGGSKSDLWCQIIADVVNIPVVRLSSSDTALAGAAILAFTALGKNVPHSLPAAQAFSPCAESVALYEQSYCEYENKRQHFYP